MKKGMINKNPLARMALFAVLAFVPMVLYAQDTADVPITFSELLDSFIDVIGNWKGMTGLAIASSIVMLLVQSLKTDIIQAWLGKVWPDSKTGRRFIIFLLSQISAIIIGMTSGHSLIDSIVTGLFVQGGAVAMYEHLKPLFKKKEEAKK